MSYHFILCLLTLYQKYKYILNDTYRHFFLKLLYMSLERIVDKPIDDTMQQVYSSSFTAKNDIAENMAAYF